MKKLLLIIIVLVASQSLSLAEAIKGGRPAQEYSRQLNGRTYSLIVESERQSEYRINLIEDDRDINIAGILWQIEAPSNLNATITFQLPISSLKSGADLSNLPLYRIHEGILHKINTENINVTDEGDKLLIRVRNVNEFSVWGFFSAPPPPLIPTLGEWAAILLGSLLVIFGTYKATKLV